MTWRCDGQPLADARIALESAVGLFGDGVFSSLRVEGGHAWLVDLHVERMLASARTLRLTAPSRDDLERAVVAACSDADPQRVYRLRVMLVPQTPSARQTTTYTQLTEHDDAVRPVALAVSGHTHPGLRSGKTLSWQWSRTAMREAAELGVDDVILTDGTSLIETATGALAVRVDGRWGVVDCPGAAPLQSTTVAALRALGHMQHTHHVLSSQVDRISAAMVLSAIRVVTPVSHLGGRPLDAATKESDDLRYVLALHCGRAYPSRVAGPS